MKAQQVWKQVSQVAGDEMKGKDEGVEIMKSHKPGGTDVKSGLGRTRRGMLGLVVRCIWDAGQLTGRDTEVDGEAT